MVSTMKGDFLWEKIVVEKYFKKGFRVQLETTEIGFLWSFHFTLKRNKWLEREKIIQKIRFRVLTIVKLLFKIQNKST